VQVRSRANTEAQGSTGRRGERRGEERGEAAGGRMQSLEDFDGDFMRLLPEGSETNESVRTHRRDNSNSRSEQMSEGLEVANEGRVEQALKERKTPREGRRELKRDPSFRAVKYPKSAEERAVLSDALKMNFLFNSLTPSILFDCVGSFQRLDADPGKLIIEQGDTDTAEQAFFIIEEGIVDVVVGGIKVSEMMAGNSFGEMSLVYGKPRSATIRASACCKLWALDRLTFEQSLAAAVNYDLNQTEHILRKVPLLQVSI
jgi:hypothetical protein